MIDEMRGGFRHPPSIAGRTDAVSFARKGDKKITTAICAVGTGEIINLEQNAEDIVDGTMIKTPRRRRP